MIELLNKISKNGIVIDVNKGELELLSSNEGINEDLLLEIKRNKKEIIAFLTKNKSLSFSSLQYEEIPVCEKYLNYPLSSAQFRLWLAERIDNGKGTFNVPKSIILNGVYDISKFQKAIYAVIERHEILRTIFKEDEEGQVRQYALDAENLNFVINYNDFRDDDNPEKTAQKYILDDSYKSFDLVKGPLFRASLLQLSNDKYVFYYNMHHIISDEWSTNILSNDVMKYYQAYVSNTVPEVTALRIQYKDYAVWQQNELNNSSFQNHKEYWENKLSGELTRINLLPNKQQQIGKTSAGKSLKTFFSEDLTMQINEFIKVHDGSLFTVVLTTLNVLFHRYTSNKDIIIGSPVTERDHPDLENQIGFYVNLLALRNHVNPENSFIDFYENVKEGTLNDFKHKQYPFDKLVGDLNLRSDQGKSAIFDISLTINSNNPISLNEIDEKIQDNGFSGCRDDIEFHLSPFDNTIALQVIFNSEVYEKELIENIINHFKSLFSSVLVSPQIPLRSIDYLSKKETDELLDGFNDTLVDYNQNSTMLSFFYDQVKKTPDATAIVYENTRLTYEALNKKSNQISNYLINEHNVQKGDYIGIHLDRSEHSIIYLLAILKTGSIYVPIDTKYPLERKKYIIKDAGIKLLVSNLSYKKDLEYFDNIIYTSNIDVSKFSSENLTSVLSEDLAYVIYTSGSTGKPKGVPIKHKAILNTILSQIDIFDIKNNSKGLQFASFSFDASISEIFIILLSGAELYIVNDETRNATKLLENYIIDNSIDVATLPPSYFQIMSNDSLKNLKTLITAGESPDAKKVMSILPFGNNYYNAYGPTETSICASIFKMSNTTNVSLESNIVPIGVPIHNTTIYILDDDGNLKPKGTLGEICVGGAGVSEGYLNQLNITNEKFIPNPYKKGEKLYKTGDLGYWLSNGNLVFAGRKDDQVKINGHRIELGEIETALNELNTVDQSVVLFNKNEDKQLVAYYTALKDVTPIQIQEELQKKLPHYMVPKLYMKLEEFSLNSNGKIDKKVLPKLNEEAYIKKEYEAPSNEVEKLLVSLCEAVLGVSKIGVGDNFLNLGGDSIKSILLVSRLRQQGYILNVADVLRVPVLKNLVKLIKKGDKVIDQSEVEGEVMLTPPQLNLFKDSGLTKMNHFNQSILLKSKEPLDINIVKKSIGQLVRHHDALRITFTEDNGIWKQYNHKYDEHFSQVVYHDLSLEEDGLKEMGMICEKIQSTLNLSKGPLFSVSHFKFSNCDYVAFICHHLLVDEISCKIIKEDFTTLYEQNILGEIISLPQKTDSYKKWASALQDYANNDLLQKEIKYWKSLEHDISKFSVENNLDKGKITLNTKASFILDETMTNLLLTKVHNVYNTEVNDILLTGLGLAIKDVFNINKTLVNLEGHGREDIIDEIDLSRTVGWFSAEHPVVLDVSETLDIEESLVGIKDSIRKIPSNGIGYSILKYLNKDYSSNLTPVIMFNYLADFDANDKTNKKRKELFEYASEYIGKDVVETTEDTLIFNFTGTIIEGELTLSLSYNDEQFSKETIDNFIKKYEQNVTELIQKLSLNEKTHITSADLTYSKLNYKELKKINEDKLLEDLYELSPAQEGMYYHWLTSKHNYFQQFCYKIQSTNVSIDDLKQAYEKLIQRYPVLRTQFISTDSGKILQLVKKEISGSFVYNKFPSELENKDIHNWVEERKREDLNKGLDLSSPSQMRLTILDLGNSQYEFIWSIHHILIDGWCAGILLNDFYAILQGIHNNVNVELPVTKPYSEYIKWLRSVDKDASLKYWEKYLENFTDTIKIPFEYSTRIAKERKDITEIIKFSGEDFEKIHKTCVHLGVTQNSFIELIWGVLLSYYNNTNDVVFGSVVSGRPSELEGVEEMVGVFLNTVPVRVSYTESDTFEDLLQKVQNNAIESLPHHYVNLAEVQSQSEKGMHLIDHIMVFENYLIQDQIQDQFHSEENSEKVPLSIASESLEVLGQINYDFNITISFSTSSLKVSFSFDKNKYEEELIQKMGSHFYTIVQNIINNSGQLVKDIVGITKEEENELQYVFNSNKEERLQGTVLDLINEQVKENPENIALSFKGETVTYAELSKKTNQLVNTLVVKGVKKGSIVPICVKRSLDTVISMLSVLKAGATYVPLDEKMPIQRIDHIIKDVNAELIITNNEFAEKFNNTKVSTLLYLEEIKNSNEYIDKEVNISSDDLAYIMYTSGTTGDTKRE